MIDAVAPVFSALTCMLCWEFSLAWLSVWGWLREPHIIKSYNWLNTFWRLATQAGPYINVYGQHFLWPQIRLVAILQRFSGDGQYILWPALWSYWMTKDLLGSSPKCMNTCMEADSQWVLYTLRFRQKLPQIISMLHQCVLYSFGEFISEVYVFRQLFSWTFIFI